MLRLVREWEETPQNLKLREALDRVTRESSVQTSILDKHEAEALYRVLASMSFTQDQLDAWVERLLADHPYNRRSKYPRPGLWAWARWVVFGSDKPQTTITESVDEWRERAELYVGEQMAYVDDPTWLEQPLRALNITKCQIEYETGEFWWTIPVMRWALVQLLTTPSDVVMSDNSATGSDAQLG